MTEPKPLTEEVKDWIETQQALYDTEKYRYQLEALTFNPWTNLNDLRVIIETLELEYLQDQEKAKKLDNFVSEYGNNDWDTYSHLKYENQQLKEEREQIEKNFKATLDKMLEASKECKRLKKLKERLEERIEEIREKIRYPPGADLEPELRILQSILSESQKK